MLDGGTITIGNNTQVGPNCKKQEGANVAANAATDSNVPDVPTDTPKEKKDDLPF